MLKHLRFSKQGPLLWQWKFEQPASYWPELMHWLLLNTHTHTHTHTKVTKVIFGKTIWMIHVTALPLALQHFSWTQSTAMSLTASETWMHINVAIKHFRPKCTAVWWLWENVFSLSPIVGFALGMTCNNYVRLKCTCAGLVFACYKNVSGQV